MTSHNYTGPERRRIERFEWAAPLAYKICKKETVSRLLDGYTVDVSSNGLRCTVKDKVNTSDILWLSFDRGQLATYQEIEKNTLIYQNGVIGQIVWVDRKDDDTYDVGIQFITRQEKNFTHIYPKVHFLKEV